jgi:hypothetical protein
MPHISQVLDTDMLYWYVLLDQAATGSSIIAERSDPAGNIIPNSPLYEYLRSL